MKENLSLGRVLGVGCDGMSPTPGDISPLDRYDARLKPLGGCLIVDESHSFGVLGDHGRGAIEKFGLSRAERRELATVK